MPFQLDTLRRHPDIEAPELVAVDAADRLLLHTALPLLTERPPTVAIVDDAYGALTLGVVQALAAADAVDASDLPDTPRTPTPGAGRVRVFQDGLVHERALARNAELLRLTGSYTPRPLDASLLHGADIVLLRLPRSLDELDEIAGVIAAHAPADVRVMAVGRVKHMSLSMNAVLGRYFGDVRAGLARQKSRVLTATGPITSAVTVDSTWPRTASHDIGLARPLEVRAYGATFGGAALDPGTQLLLPHLRDLRMEGPDGAPADVVDLGCGNGAIASALALMHPGITVHATDQSASAVASTEATAIANGVSSRVVVTRDDALSGAAAGSAGTIVLNPPFHIGSTVHTGIALKLFRESARVLRPGGRLVAVWNSHLAYRSALERLVGPTVQLDRSPRFTVTVSTRR